MKGKYMKIELIRQTFDSSVGYKHKPIKWCCEKLKNNPLINLTDEYTDDNNLDEYEHPIPSVAMKHTEIISSWGDEWEEDTYYKINYCPFCNKPIEISIIKEEDVTEFYSNLVKERKETWDKYRKTDSKRKSDELMKRVHYLDDCINWFYDLSEYKKLEEI